MDETTARRQVEADLDNIERQIVEAIVEERTRCHKAALACWRDIADFRGMDYRATKYVGILAEEIVTGCPLDPGEESPTMDHIWSVYVAAERARIRGELLEWYANYATEELFAEALDRICPAQETTSPSTTSST